MTVYVDLLFGLNTAINYLLLRGAAIVGGAPGRRRRLVGAAAAGGLYAVAAVLPGAAAVRSVPGQIAAAVAMVILAFGWRRSSVKQGLYFLALSFALSGVVLLAVQFVEPDLKLLGGRAYYAVTTPALLLLAGISYALAALVLSGAGRHTGGDLATLTLGFGDRQVTLRALRDTGNTLRDPVSGETVVVADAAVLRRLLPSEDISREDLADPASLLPLLTRRGQVPPGSLSGGGCGGRPSAGHAVPLWRRGGSGGLQPQRGGGRRPLRGIIRRCIHMKLWQTLLMTLGLWRPNSVFYIGGSDVLPPPLKPEEEQQCIAALAQGDEAAKKTLIEHNLRLVVYIARRFENTGVGIEDLISIGTIGLIKAVNTFKADKKIKLATYSSRCIENEILMHIRKIAGQRAELSLDEPINTDWDGNELLLSDVLGTDSDTVMRPMEDDVDHQLLREALSRLPERERTIMVLRYGLEGKQEKTQKEVADLMGISQSYISRLEKRITARLKREISRQIYV